MTAASENINKLASRRTAAYGGVMGYINRVVVAIFCALLMVSFSGVADAGKSGKEDTRTELEKKRAKAADIGKVKHSGKNKRNRRIKLNFAPELEIVEGTITGLDRKGIYMDGEYFRIANSDIEGISGRKLKMKDLFFGLKARVKFSYGTIEKTTIIGLRRMPVMDLKEMRKRMEESRAWRMGEGVDKNIPRELLDFKPEPPDEGPGSRKGAGGRHGNN